MGFIKLLAGEYLLVITERESIGSIHDKNIFRVGAFQILPLARNLDKLTEEEVKGQWREIWTNTKTLLEITRAILCQFTGISSSNEYVLLFLRLRLDSIHAKTASVEFK
jgi:hypothetical protein